jgi:diguanylate cyclase (GGDEF)-like protein
VVAAGEVATAIVMPPLGAALLGSTGAAVFFGRRSERLVAVEHERELARAKDRTVDLTLTDELTGLPNRQNLIEQVARDTSRAERYGQPLTLAVVEIERFAEMGQVWGQEMADQAVQHVAETLSRITRNSDFLARLDERRFAVVLVGCERDQASAFGERVMLAVSNRPLQGRERGRLPVYASVDIQALQYDPERYRGPLDFLSAAGAEPVLGKPAIRRPERRSAEPTPELTAITERPASSQRTRTFDPQSLRRQLVRDYYPEGKAEDFASAWGRFRQRAG